MEVYHRKSGNVVYARVFSATPFRWEVRFNVNPGIANLDCEGVESFGNVTPLDGRADLAPITLEKDTSQASSYMLLVMPLVDGLPMDGSEDNQPDHRRFVRLR